MNEAGAGGEGGGPHKGAGAGAGLDDPLDCGLPATAPHPILPKAADLFQAVVEVHAGPYPPPLAPAS